MYQPPPRDPHDPYLPDAHTQGLNSLHIQYPQDDSTAYTPGLYGQVGGYPPPPPPLSTQARPAVHFPLLHGKACRRDIFVILGFSLSFIFVTVFLFLSTPPNGVAIPIWMCLVLPAGTLLASKLLGTWRALLQLLIGLLVLGFIPLAGFSVHMYYLAYPPLVGFFIATWLIGWIYEHRQTNGLWFSVWTTLLGSLLLSISLEWTSGIAAIAPLYVQSGNLLLILVDIFVVAIVQTIVTLMLEGIVYLVIKNTTV